MKKDYRITKADGVTQITTLDERWYSKEVDGILLVNPSITWVARYAPMPPALLKWYTDKGMDEAEQVKREAGERGSKVHQAIESLLLGNKVKLDDGFNNPDTKEQEELTPDEYWCVMTFEAFWKDYNKEHKIKLIDTEQSLWVDAIKGEKYGYAGTRDIKVIEDGKPKIWDIKTSKDIHLGHEVQLSALKHADPENPLIGVIQVGYARNKNGWKATDIEDKFHLFQASKLYWSEANPEAKPKQKDYPAEIVLSNTMLDNLGK
jgi:hypothetical protein